MYQQKNKVKQVGVALSLGVPTEKVPREQPGRGALESAVGVILHS